MMYELTGNITNASVSYMSGKAVITLEFNEKDTALKMVDELKTLKNWRLKSTSGEKNALSMLTTTLGSSLLT